MDERPAFFKVFIPELCSPRMQIPPAFAAKYLRGKNMKNAATLLRDGQKNIWQVEMSAEGRAFFLEKGWVRFVVDNQIEQGDFLVFELSHNLLFDFKHYGRSACEKEKRSLFRFTVKQEDLELEEEEEEEAEYSNETGEEEEVAVNNENFAEEEDHYDEGEEEEENDDDEDEGEEVEKNSEDDGDYEESEEADDDDVEVVELEENKTKEQESELGSKKKKTYTPRLTIEDFGRIEEEIFGSGVPIPQNPYFVLKIRPQKRRELFIPVDVVRYHDLKLPSEMKIVNEMGKGSKAKVKVWKIGRIALKGWAAFCKWNHLKTDDNCLLEFVPDRENKRQLCLQVRIFRA